MSRTEKTVPAVVQVRDVSFLNWVTGSFVNSVVSSVSKNEAPALVEDAGLAAADSYASFSAAWAAETGASDVKAGGSAKKKPSLVRALWRTYRRELLAAAVAKAGWGAGIVLSASLFVRSLLSYVAARAVAGAANKEAPGYLWTVFFFVTTVLLSLSLQQMNALSARLGLRVKSACVTAVYRKLLVEDRTAASKPGGVEGDSDAGPPDVISLVGTDCAKLADATLTLQFLWSGVIEATAIIAVLLGLVGRSALPALGALILLVPTQYAVGMWIAKTRKRVVAASDARVGLMDELLRAIKLVKMYNWQQRSADAVAALRSQETALARLGGILKSFNVALVFLLPPLIALAIFGVHSIEADLDSVLAFTTLSLFNTLRLPLVQLPKALRAFAEGSAASARLEAYLLSQERAPRTLAPRTEIVFDNASFTYGGGAANESLLRDVSLHIPKGTLVMVAGPVGSGKSSLIAGAILGEMRLVSGTASIGGSFAYVPQTPWCAHGTVRDNILFGKAWDESRYRRVLWATALEPDIRMMDDGDLTLIGERGANLSGGQKQRIALARAAYSGADTVLLDSPLSAVDQFTSSHIFQHCIRDLMLAAGATVVLATHQVDLFSRADLLIVMANCAIAYAGPHSAAVVDAHFPNASATPGTDAELVAALQLENGGDSRVEPPSTSPRLGGARARLGTQVEAEPIVLSGGSPRAELSPSDAALDFTGSVLNARGNVLSRAISLRADMLTALRDVDTPDTLLDVDGGDTELTLMRTTPTDSAAPSRRLSRAPSLSIPSLRSAGVVAAPRAPTPTRDVKPKARSSTAGGEGPSADLSLAAYGAVVQKSNRPAATVPHANGYASLFWEMKWPLVLVSLLIFVATQVTRIYSDIFISTWVTHKREEAWYIQIYAGYVGAFLVLLLLRGLFFYAIAERAASRLHNTMFSRILRAPMSVFTTTPLGSLLSTFAADMDQIDEALQDNIMMAVIYLCILGTTIGVVVRVIPIFAAVAGLLAISFVYFFRLYMRTSRVLKSATGRAGAAVVTHVSETLQGLTVIHAYGAAPRFSSDSMTRLDASSAAQFNVDALQLWLSFRLDLIGCLLVLGTCLLAIALEPRLPAASAGLAISNSFQILLFASVMVRTVADIDSSIACVERVVAVGAVEQEVDLPLTHESCPRDGWPSRGEVDFHGVVMSYLPALPAILKGVTFNIRAGEKVGVAGRTGAGKSSLIMTLFRLVGLSQGAVRIDGIDVGTLHLGELRRRIAIIPQEPVMFKGTIRSNLDPFSERTDAELLVVLERCMLGGLRLDQAVEAMGANFSLGQQQLLCLARAMLNPSKLLVLDEATAALDLATDALVQRVLRTEFADRTVITIAHRLDTIIDSDRILVLDAGRVAEFASPHELLNRPGSIFGDLCRQTGAQYEVLRTAAARHHDTMAALTTHIVQGDGTNAEPPSQPQLSVAIEIDADMSLSDSDRP